MRTSWKLFGNPGFGQLVRNFLGCQQVGNLIDLSRRYAGWQLAAQVECRKRPGLQQVVN